MKQNGVPIAETAPAQSVFNCHIILSVCVDHVSTWLKHGRKIFAIYFRKHGQNTVNMEKFTYLTLLENMGQIPRHLISMW